MEMFGCQSLAELNARLSSLGQVAGVERLTVSEGPGRGNEVIQARNGSGLFLEILVSRGFDLGRCEIAGVPVSWRSALGHVSPQAYDPRDREWNRGFGGGLMTTCGLGHAGRSETVDGRDVGLHGRVSFLPAQVGRCLTEEGEAPAIVLSATVREAMVGGDQLALYRTVRLPLFENRILVHDRVVNEGGTHAVHMMLYHINLGFPLISPTASLSPIDSPRELVAGAGDPEDYRRIPNNDRGEADVIWHRDVYAPDGLVRLAVENVVPMCGGAAKLSLRMVYNKAQCPCLSQWRHFGRGMNVFALEPGNVSTRGMNFHRQEGTLTTLKPGEFREYDLELSAEAEWVKA